MNFLDIFINCYPALSLSPILTYIDLIITLFSKKPRCSFIRLGIGV